jgi:hypothetical protein
MLKELDSAKTAAFARQSRQSGADGLLRVWYGLGLLSNAKTLAVNALSTATTIGWTIPSRMIAALGTELGGMRGNPDYVQMTEPLQMLFAVKHGYREAIDVAVKAFLTGERRYGSNLKSVVENTGSVDRMSLGAFKSDRLSENFGVTPESYLGAALDYLGVAADVFPRAMSGTDEFLKLINERMELYGKAARDAAGGEPTAPSEFAQRTRQAILDNKLDPADMNNAKAAALYNTFNSPSGPFVRFATAGQEALGKLPYMGVPYYLMSKAVVPFVNIPFNVTKWIMHNGPLAPISERFRAAVGNGGADAQLAIANMTLGSIYLTSMAYLAMEGYNQGALPTNPAQRKMYEAEGYMADSVKVGDQSFSYSRLGPLGLMAGWAADVVNIAGHFGEDELMPLVGAMALAISRPLLDQTYLKGVSQGLSALTSQDPRAMEQYIRSQGTSFMPGFLRGMRQEWDQYRRQVDTMKEAMQNQTPWGSSDLAPVTDPFGRPIKTGYGVGPEAVRLFGLINPIAYKRMENNPVIKEIINNKVQVSMPSEWLFGRGNNPYDLTPPDTRTGVQLKGWDYYYYVKTAGDKAMHDLETLITSQRYRGASEGPDGGKAQLIGTVINASREWARQKLLQEDAVLKGQVQEKQRARRDALQGSRPALTPDGRISTQ